MWGLGSATTLLDEAGVSCGGDGGVGVCAILCCMGICGTVRAAGGAGGGAGGGMGS